MCIRNYYPLFLPFILCINFLFYSHTLLSFLINPSFPFHLFSPPFFPSVSPYLHFPIAYYLLLFLLDILEFAAEQIVLLVFPIRGNKHATTSTTSHTTYVTLMYLQSHSIMYSHVFYTSHHFLCPCSFVLFCVLMC